MINVEMATIQDQEAVARLFNQYRCFYQQDSDLALAKRFMLERLKQQDSVIFIAKNEQQDALGFVQLYPSFSSVSAHKTWILNDLFVSENDRGAGVASALLQQAKNHAKATQAKGLSLMTAHTNHGAQKLYESLGYIKQDYYNYFLEC